MTEVEIRPLDDTASIRALVRVFNQVWGTTTDVVAIELTRAIAHAGGYVVAAYDGDSMVGGSLGFLARHGDDPALHSHLTGVLPGVQHTGLGRTLKRHQRTWAADHGLRCVTWTFDPLVRRNAWFNLEVLGASVDEYLIDFYGPIDDQINAGDESDRLLVVWPVDDVTRSSDDADTSAVATPEDIVELRRTDPGAAVDWRHRVRHELGGPLAAGARVVGFTRAGEYLVSVP